MLAVVEFEDGTFGLQNEFTGFLLRDDEGSIRQFKTPKKALRRGRKIERNLTKVISRVTKQPARV